MKSFRLDCDLATALSRCAETRQLTETTLVSNILEEAIRFEPLVQNIGGLGLSKPVFTKILAQTNLDGLEIAAAECARENVPVIFHLLELEKTTASLDFFLKKILEGWGWFKADTKIKNGNYTAKIVHDYGLMWSIFLKSYMTDAFELVIKERPQFEVTDRTVILTVPEMHTLS